MKKYDVCVIKGDGIGPEIIEEAIKVLDAVSHKFNFELNFDYRLMGGAAIDIMGVPLPDETLNTAKSSDAVLFGAIGGAKWDGLPRELRPESGLLKIRKELGAFANLRPAMIFDELINASTLKPEIIKGVDIMVVRELTGGIYFGQPRVKNEKDALNTMCYNVSEIERVAKVAFEAALLRNKKITLVDKANVLETSQLWREVVSELAGNYEGIDWECVSVDTDRMQLGRALAQLDVILTENLFGDILSDEGSMICGSIGLLPSASIGSKVGIYEPIHGSAPDIAGQGIANPIATILSAAMMLKYAFGKNEAAEAIELAVRGVLRDGYRTKDIAQYDAKEICSTVEIGSIIADYAAKA